MESPPAILRIGAGIGHINHILYEAHLTRHNYSLHYGLLQIVKIITKPKSVVGSFFGQVTAKRGCFPATNCSLKCILPCVNYLTSYTHRIAAFLDKTSGMLSHERYGMRTTG